MGEPHAYCTEHDQPLEWCMQGVEGVTPHGGPAMSAALHLGPGDYVKARDELDEIEVGGRASRAMKAWDFSDCFGLLGDRILNAITILTVQVAASTSWLGGRFPPEWELPENWTVPRDGLVQDEKGTWSRP